MMGAAAVRDNGNEAQVLWPRHRSDYLTEFHGYQSNLALMHAIAVAPRRSRLSVIGIPTQHVFRCHTDGFARRFRLFQAGDYTSPWIHKQLVNRLNEIPEFAAIPDKAAIANRIMASDVEFPLGIMAEMAYRAKYRPQREYRGEGSPKAKLKEAQVVEIRQRYATEQPKPSQSILAKQYGVSYKTINDIVCGDTWQDVGGPIVEPTHAIYQLLAKSDMGDEQRPVCPDCGGYTLPMNVYGRNETARYRCKKCGRAFFSYDGVAVVGPACGNYLKGEKYQTLLRAFASGLSVRASARVAGCSKLTALKIAQALGRKGRCPCGDDSGHKGWCFWRYLRSESRQRFMAQWSRCQAGRGRLVAMWPFMTSAAPDGSEGEELIDRINRIVPHYLSEQVRQEVCQDMAVALLSTDAVSDERAIEICSELTRSVYRQYPTRFGPMSLDQPRYNRETKGVPLLEAIPAGVLSESYFSDSDAGGNTTNVSALAAENRGVTADTIGAVALDQELTRAVSSSVHVVPELQFRLIRPKRHTIMWIRLDDQIAHHPKFIAAGPVASWLWICGQSYCNRYETDGFIPSEALTTLGSVSNPARHAETLVKHRLWEEVQGGWRVHDYHDYQPTKEEIDRRREQRRKAGRIGGSRRVDAPSPGKRDAKHVASDLLPVRLAQRTLHGSTPVPVPDPIAPTEQLKKPRQDTHVREALDHYAERFKAAVGQKPAFTRGKDPKLVLTSIRARGLSETKALLDAMFDCGDPFLRDAGFSLGAWSACLNKLIVWREGLRRKASEPWDVECQRLHGGKCGSHLIHDEKKFLDNRKKGSAA